MRAMRSEFKYGGSGVRPLLVSQEKFSTAEGTCKPDQDKISTRVHVAS